MVHKGKAMHKERAASVLTLSDHLCRGRSMYSKLFRIEFESLILRLAFVLLFDTIHQIFGRIESARSHQHPVQIDGCFIEGSFVAEITLHGNPVRRIVLISVFCVAICKLERHMRPLYLEARPSPVQGSNFY